MENKEINEKEDIKNKIIEVAADIFAEKGYQNTTVRDICQKSGAYQLSINYHFGNKENLFKEVIYKTYEDTEEYDLFEKIKDMSPKKKLEKIIRTRIYAIFSNEKKGIFFKIGSHNGICENSVYEETVHPIMRAYFYYIRDVFAELIGENANDFELNYCAYLLISHISIFSLFKKAKFILFNAGRGKEVYDSEKEYNPTPKQLEQLIQYVEKFIFAGVEEFKKNKQEKIMNEEI